MHQVKMTVERSYCHEAMSGRTSTRVLLIMLNNVFSPQLYTVDTSWLKLHCAPVDLAEFLDFDALTATLN
jgi:hypothetical protein